MKSRKNSIQPEYQVHIKVEYVLLVIGLATKNRKQDNDAAD